MTDPTRVLETGDDRERSWLPAGRSFQVIALSGSPGPHDHGWLTHRLPALVEEIRSLPQFVQGLDVSSDIAEVCADLAMLSDATGQVVREVAAWYRANADELYSPTGVYGASQAATVEAQVAVIEETVRLLTDAAVRLSGARRTARQLELRHEQELDPLSPPDDLDEWWEIELCLYTIAATPTILAYETREAAMWYAGHLAEEADRNSEVVVRRATPTGRDDAETARLRGRADLSDSPD